ncbi:hypothetical protein Rrhod_0686 [Rhodococcus rhodnii LMG 5362]|uniref:Uncharacterized protein n=1 Tax=Rhodococcus rhodnii LMG 5362 TaxID=1273125 RepID=R7WRQ1_9NOCA|nr:hypothetical protein Rrhod_0686 [Rhodococcus rhodnii LMG 5362]
MLGGSGGRGTEPSLTLGRFVATRLPIFLSWSPRGQPSRA